MRGLPFLMHMEPLIVHQGFVLKKRRKKMQGKDSSDEFIVYQLS